MIANIENPTAPAPKPRRERLGPVASPAGMESLVAEITALQVEQAGLAARMAELTVASERALAAQLRPLQLQAETIARRVKTRLAKVEVFVTTHRDDLLPDRRKSFELPTAIVGFTLSTKAKVVLANDGDDWTSAAHRLEALEWGGDYVRNPEPEVDKEALIASRASLTPKQLAAAGLRIEQGEKFYVQPKSQIAEPVKAG